MYFLNSGALGSPGSASTTADPCGTFACLECENSRQPFVTRCATQTEGNSSHDACTILSEVKHRLERS